MATPAAPQVDVVREWWKVRLAFAALVAVLVPSPFGWWPSVSLVLWGLVGDPTSILEAAGFIGVGMALLGIYTAVAYAAFGILLHFVRVARVRMLVGRKSERAG